MEGKKTTTKTHKLSLSGCPDDSGQNWTLKTRVLTKLYSEKCHQADKVQIMMLVQQTRRKREEQKALAQGKENINGKSLSQKDKNMSATNRE